MNDGSKVLTGLLERRALEEAVAELAEATDAADLARRAEAIAAHGHAALAVLLAHLDTDDPQLRGGLGQIASRLDRGQVVAALRRVARTRQRSAQARLSALTLLERFLDEPVDESLLNGIEDSEQVALRSLDELIRAMDRDETAILEYWTQLAAQPPEVARMILDAVPRLPPHRHLVTLLRIFAQDDNLALARSAIEQLGRARVPEALRTLESLVATLPSPLRDLAARNVRKLRLSGVREPAAERLPARPRALMSAVDGSGTQMIWFIRQPAGQVEGGWLSLIARDPDGVIACFGSREIRLDLPPDQPVGTLYPLLQGDAAPPVHLLEVPFEMARRAVRSALALNRAASTPVPLAYRLWNPLIWDAETADEVEVEPEVGNYPAQVTAALLDHPAFADWLWQAGEPPDLARQLLIRRDIESRRGATAALAATYFGTEAVASYQRRLRSMSEWLAVAGQREAARLAAAAAAALAETPPEQSPLVRRLISIGLDMWSIAAWHRAAIQSSD